MEKDALMFFPLSKTVAYLLLPSTILIALGLVGVVLLAARRKHAGVCLVSVSIVLLAIAGCWLTGNLLTHALESRFPRWNATRAPDGIVVLGGAVKSRLSQDFGEAVLGDEADRILAMAKLARAYPAARIIYSGGDASLLGNRLPEANFITPLLEGLGIPRDRVMLESNSRNTAENAVFTKEILKPKPGELWLLVTSAQHMPRAIGCFRRVGFPVEAYPVGWRTGRHGDLGVPMLFGDALARFDSATHEWIGLLAYWITGRTSEFLPSPQQ
ncbi:MAG: YdcF family protein [Pseudolabrys sp.]